MERSEHRRQDHQMVVEEQRLDNARQAIRNGRRARLDWVVRDLRTHYKEMSRGFGGGVNGKRR